MTCDDRKIQTFMDGLVESREVTEFFVTYVKGGEIYCHSIATLGTLIQTHDQFISLIMGKYGLDEKNAISMIETLMKNLKRMREEADSEADSLRKPGHEEE